MYLPAHFEVADHEEIVLFVSKVGAADFVTINPEGIPLATLMPCVWQPAPEGSDEPDRLVMHMAKANRQWRSMKNGDAALAIVHGPQAYVSPSNYEAKLTTHKVVPTWNYQSVHFTGKVEVSEDVELLREIVSSLTDLHEESRDEPWRTDQSDSVYFEAQLRGIVAVILHIDTVEAKYKLSQNRSHEDRLKVIADLAVSNDPKERTVAEEMKRTL